MKLKGNHVCDRRRDIGMSQADLASSCQITRQALSAIENGRQVPSTVVALRLARALSCPVEELFELPDEPEVAVETFREIPVGKRVHVGRVGDKWVAHPATTTERGADAISSGDGFVRALSPKLAETFLVSGCAPLFGVLTDKLRREFDLPATWIRSNSSIAQAHLRGGLVHVAGVHLSSRKEHEKAAKKACPEGAVLINLAKWNQGYVVAPNSPIKEVSDLKRKGLRIVSREEGAAARQVLIDQIGITKVRKAPVVFSHDEVGFCVKHGVADVGVAIESVAIRMGLRFLPIREERFDLIVPDSFRESLFVKRLVDLMSDARFKDEVSSLGGYDPTESGHWSTVG